VVVSRGNRSAGASNPFWQKKDKGRGGDWAGLPGKLFFDKHIDSQHMMSIIAVITKIYCRFKQLAKKGRGEMISSAGKKGTGLAERPIRRGISDLRHEHKTS